MRYSEARPGRVFVLRLEDGEIVHRIIEQFAQEQDIQAASVIIVGGADEGSTLVVGPKIDREPPLEPMKVQLDNAHEIVGAGTLFRDQDGVPLLHMHMACGRAGKTLTGCVREGVRVWHVMEVIIHELVGTTARRAREEPLGIPLLQP